MHDIQEVVRLHRLRCSGREIARQLGMGRETVRQYLHWLADAGMLDGPVDALPEVAQLMAVVGAPAAPPQQVSSLAPWQGRIEPLRARGAGPKAIHDFLRLNDPEFAGSLSAVKRLCRRMDAARGPAATDVSIPVQTGPGEVAQVDFGYVGERYIPAEGVLRRCWFFAMTLGFSRRLFCDVVVDQRASTWLDLHVRAFEHFGGVPRVIVPDNLKAAVVRAAFGADDDATLNRSYRELARHHGFQIDPTPPRSPQKKGKVEGSVGYVKRNFLATCEARDLPETRECLKRWLAGVADERVHGTTGRRPRELFEEAERMALLPLPAARWELVEWKHVRLHRDSHVQVDGALYSAPWKHLGEELWARCTRGRVALYRGDELLWTHVRVERGQRSTMESHLPEHRRDLRHRSREYWLERAGLIGEQSHRLAEAIFGSDDVLLKLRKVQAVVSHLEQFPKARAEAAAQRALHFGALEYGAIKSILRQGLDLQPLPHTEPSRPWANGSRHARSPGHHPLSRSHQDDREREGADACSQEVATVGCAADAGLAHA